LHAWAISQRLKQLSGDVLQVSDGSRYPALHKLEQEGWIKGEWRDIENGPQFYTKCALALRSENAPLAYVPSHNPSAPNAIPRDRVEQELDQERELSVTMRDATEP
jgi:hypothetical protein